MKKLSIVLSVLCISMLIAVPAFAQLAYQLDVGQNGTFETGGTIDLGVSESVTIDIYVSGYTCSPGSDLFGTQKYILLNESKVAVSGYPYDITHGGPWDDDVSEFFQKEPNVYYLATANFMYVTVVGGMQKLGTMTLTGTACGIFTIRVANNLTSFGYSAYNDGYIADCNLDSKFPANAVLTVRVATPEETDGDGVRDCVDNCPTTPNPGQQDTLPPQGNGIGDACDCEGNFDCDRDQDSLDTATFKRDLGRSALKNPCTTVRPCNGDFTCDRDVDSTDAAQYKTDAGRSVLKNPCPICNPTEPWCVY